MKRLQVIGIGNRIMGDDGIGVYVVEELIKQQFLYNIESVAGKTDINIEYAVGESEIIIEYVLGETDIDYCLDRLDKKSLVIIIDAAMTGKEPGTVTEFTIYDMSLCTSMLFSIHNHNIIEAARMMLNHCCFTIIGIEPEIVDYRFGMSDTLNISFPNIMEDVEKCLLKIARQQQRK